MKVQELKIKVEDSLLELASLTETAKNSREVLDYLSFLGSSISIASITRFQFSSIALKQLMSQVLLLGRNLVVGYVKEKRNPNLGSLL